MTTIMDMARDLGTHLARTDEYQALRRAMQAANEDREITELRNDLDKLEATITASLRAGSEPEDDEKSGYEAALSKLQTNATYQRLVAAQTNFDKIVQKVNEQIGKGIEEGGSSRIILT